MSDIVGTISNICVVVGDIKEQIDSLKELAMMGDKMANYQDALGHLAKSLEKLEQIFDTSSPHAYLFQYNVLSCSIVKIWVDKLIPIRKFITKISEWQHAEGCHKAYKFARIYCNSKPSLVKARINKYCDRIYDALYAVQNLNRNIFGSAIRIENPVLRKAWMLSGENQLNETALPKNIIKENLFTLLKIEMKEKLEKDKSTYIRLVNKLLKDLDESAGTEGDNLISVQELNELDPRYNECNDANTLLRRYGEDINKLKLLCKIKTLSDSNMAKASSSSAYIIPESPSKKRKSVKNVKIAGVDDIGLGLDAEHKSEEEEGKEEEDEEGEEDIADDETVKADHSEAVSLELSSSEKFFDEIKIEDNLISLEKITTITGCSCSSKAPASLGYGGDFPAIMVLDMTIPSIDDHVKQGGDERLYEKELVEVLFSAVAKDQGWGGTNHAHVRYQINDSACNKAFNIKRDKENPDNIYSFTINGSDINNGDRIQMWLFCPPWGGWNASFEKISCVYKYY